MCNYTNALKNIKNKNCATRIKQLYGNQDGVIVEQTTRFNRLIKKHEELYNSDALLHLITAPGRIEVCGNHTDHNNGKVLAAAINKDVAAIVSKRNDDTIIFHSDGYGIIKVDLHDISHNAAENGTTLALIKGVAFNMQQTGYKIGGFEATVHSTVLSGSGLSSSAAIENLIVSIFDTLYNNNSIAPMEKAKIGQFAENVYFGKPSGLLDQSASAVGGLVYMDYKYQTPEVRALHFDFSSHGYNIFVVNTHSSHDNLTEAYASIPQEMKNIASFFLESSLRKVRPEQIMQHVSDLRTQFGERAVLRALHFFNENNRVIKLLDALNSSDLKSFFNTIVDSGRSSFMYLQNIYAFPNSQPIALALALAEDVLKEDGAWRVHGGGFAGTTLNFVPHHNANKFISRMESAFGENCCSELNIRSEGAALIQLN